MFAIVKTGGKQYRVAEKDVIAVDKIQGEPGDAVQFAEVLMLGGAEPVLGSPMVSGASVAGEVVKQSRDKKVIAFKKRRRKNSRRKRGHRQEFSLIRITEILTEGRKPAVSAKAEPESVPEPAPQPEAEAAQSAPQVEAAAAVPQVEPVGMAPQAATRAEPEPKSESEPEAEPAEPEAQTKPAKKAAAKPGEKKPTARKPAAKKSAASAGKDEDSKK